MFLKSVIKSSSKIIDAIAFNYKKHKPEINAGLGVAGFFITIGLTINATAKSVRKIDKEEAELNRKLTVKEKAKLVWKDGIAPTTTAIASTLLIGSSVKESNRRIAAATTACALLEESAKEYRDKVTEIVGEKKEQEIRDEIAQDKLNNNPIVTKEVIITGTGGDDLVLDTRSGRYFKSDLNTLKRVQNEANKIILDENYISLNEVYTKLELPSIDMGYEVGWSSDKGLIDFQITGGISPEGKSCLVLTFYPQPRPGYSMFYSR